MIEEVIMEIYSLYWTDPSGTQHEEVKHEPFDKLKPVIDRLLRGPGCKLVKQLIVTDVMDCTVMKVVEGKLIFPRAS